MIHPRSRYRINRGQEGPLIQIWRTRLVDEHAVARASRESLKRQGNQITEATRWHCILARKKPIIRPESDIGDTFHRVGDQECPETARRRCRYRLLEKDPGVSTVSGSRPLNGNRNFVTLAGLPKSCLLYTSPSPRDRTR